MNRILSILVCLALCSASCKKDTSIPIRGTYTISSKLFGTGPYYSYGFSFSKAGKVKFPGSGADIVSVNIQGGENNALTGALFDSPDNLNGFNKAASFDNIPEAETFFDNLLEVTATQFTEMTEAIQPGEVYALKTSSDTYAKLLILSVSLDTTESSNPFAEIKFRWQYQPDGTAAFQ